MNFVAVDVVKKRESRLDTRVVPRASVQVAVDIASEHNFWTGITMNISEGGVFVATHRLEPKGASLVVELTLPEDEKPILALAEVRWTRDYTESSDAPPGLGLKFVSIDSSALERIRAFVERVREPILFEPD